MDIETEAAQRNPSAHNYEPVLSGRSFRGVHLLIDVALYWLEPAWGSLWRL